ncbi:hypothetical protein GCM10027570_28260 [Streptomonospora sediminis]
MRIVRPAEAGAAAQLTRRYGRVDRLHVRSHERDPGIRENRVCGTALAATARTVQDPWLLRAVTGTAAAFPAYRRPGAAVRALTQGLRRPVPGRAVFRCTPC